MTPDRNALHRAPGVALVTTRPRWVAFILLSAILFASTCGRDEPPPPTQQAVEQSWQRTDQAVQQATDAEQQARHERRLRDIDRLRLQADVADLQLQTTTLRGLSGALAATALALAVWLAVEIRRRRVLAAILHTMVEQQGGEARTEPDCPPSPSPP